MIKGAREPRLVSGNHQDGMTFGKHLNAIAKSSEDEFMMPALGYRSNENRGGKIFR